MRNKNSGRFRAQSQWPLSTPRGFSLCLRGGEYLALAFEPRHDSWPLGFVEAWIGNTLHGDRGEAGLRDAVRRSANLCAPESLRTKKQHLALRHVDRLGDPVVALLRLALQHLQLGQRRCAHGATDIEWDALVRHDLLQEQPDGIARLEASCGQHPDGVCFELGIDNVWLTAARRLGVLITS